MTRENKQIDLANSARRPGTKTMKKKVVKGRIGNKLKKVLQLGLEEGYGKTSRAD